MSNQPDREGTTVIKPGDVVIIAAFDDIPEHRFRVDEVHDDCVTGTALSGPLSGCYGEPELEMILKVVSDS